ncbi:forkhead-associated protein [Mycobacterium sp. MFM001]|uniref:XRE family transcriptional regulator n=1 Tax=Mycobacterium sp. MFM001 TaxID=2049453 RepID=UPI000DA49083|nr:XRE family transcriptional regulator [Mycobacterium sp. MFM001]GBE68109.1 forkhead-associated protein [Mycobacterium sp. MFM001]
MGEFDPNEGEAQVIVSLAEAAMHMYRAAIDSLPFPEDKKFQKRAEVVLSGLRKLRAGLTDAATQSRSTSSVIVALSDVRRRYDDLMARAASAPGSSLGQQLYTARIRAKLSAEEAARGVGLRPELPDELEAGATPTEEEVVKVHQLIAALREVVGDEDVEPPAETHLNGWDEELTVNGAEHDEAEAAAH